MPGGAVRFTVRGGLNAFESASWRTFLLPRFPTDRFTTDPAAAHAALATALAAAVPCNDPAPIQPEAPDTSPSTVGCTVGPRVPQGSAATSYQTRQRCCSTADPAASGV